MSEPQVTFEYSIELLGRLKKVNNLPPQPMGEKMAIWQPGMKKERLVMIETAMQETEPRVYHHCKEVEKCLPEFLTEIEKALMGEFNQARLQMEKEIAKKNLPPMEQAQEITTRTKMIWEVALSNNLEFPESLYLPEETIPRG